MFKERKGENQKRLGLAEGGGPRDRDPDFQEIGTSSTEIVPWAMTLGKNAGRLYLEGPLRLTAAFWGDHQGRPSPGLLMSGLGIELEPDDITPVRHVTFGPHHSSRPTGKPVSVSPCRFSGVTLDRSSSRLYCLRHMTIRSLSTSSSTGVPSVSPSFRASDLGMRIPRLFPHLCTRGPMSITSFVYTKFIPCQREYQALGAPFPAQEELKVENPGGVCPVAGEWDLTRIGLTY